MGLQETFTDFYTDYARSFVNALASGYWLIEESGKELKPGIPYSLVEDIAARVWLEVWEAVSTGTMAKVSPRFLFQRAHSRYIDHMRKHHRFNQLDPNNEPPAPHTDKDALIDLHRFISRQSARTQAILNDYLAGYTTTEIATRANLHINTVQKTITGIKP
jgi:DNA-directed RNA polymerase specialized sigma24 family protein